MPPYNWETRIVARIGTGQSCSSVKRDGPLLKIRISSVLLHTPFLVTQAIPITCQLYPCYMLPTMLIQRVYMRYQSLVLLLSEIYSPLIRLLASLSVLYKTLNHLMICPSDRAITPHPTVSPRRLPNDGVINDSSLFERLLGFVHGQYPWPTRLMIIITKLQSAADLGTICWQNHLQ